MTSGKFDVNREREINLDPAAEDTRRRVAAPGKQCFGWQHAAGGAGWGVFKVCPRQRLVCRSRPCSQCQPGRSASLLGCAGSRWPCPGLRTRTYAGRYLLVVAVAEGEEAFIVTARDMTAAEKKTFHRKAR